MKQPIVVAERSSFGAKGQIVAVDEKAYDAYHEYQVVIPLHDEDGNERGSQTSYIMFQKGPIHEKGINGLTERDLLEILRHRLASFQEGKFSCFANKKAIEGIELAIAALDMRTKDRIARGVEGSSEE